MEWKERWPEPSLVAIVLSVAAVVVVTFLRLSLPATGETTAPARVSSSQPSPQTWFDRAKRGCARDGDASAFLDANPPPDPEEAHVATCHALAGDIDDARAVLLKLEPPARNAALQRLFNLIHPMADAGHEIAAGPAMELVVELWPENYQAVYQTAE